MKHRFSFLALLLLLLVGNGMYAQVYPVQGNGVLIPPYSVYLADYTQATSDRLILNVVLNDVARPELRVRLRMKIIGQGVTLETKPEYIGSGITLQGGVSQRLTGADLAEYFNPNNLNFSGISRREFEKTGALPQGFYQFCFEVLEYNRGVKISNAICASGWLILNDPPIINLPRNAEKLVPTQPQNLIFQWTPRHTGSPNSAFSTEYDIKLVELWPANRNPNDAILTSPPVLEETTRSTTFIYDVSQTPLELGRHYALQIRAKSIVGAEELDLFKNNGKSEVVTFIYGDPCSVPQNILGEATSASRFTVNWTGDFNHTNYSVRYRLADNPSAQWYTSNTLVPDVAISGLQPNTTYEFQVAGGCGVFESAYSGVARIRTFDTSEQGYSCGMPMEQFNLDPANLIDVLKVGDVIQAGDFDVKIAKVTGSNGTFTGEGVIEVPFFNKASLKAAFSNIVVNKELRMVNGYLNVTGAGVEVIPSGVMDLMDQLDETLTGLDTALANLENNRPQPFDEHAFVPDETLTLPGPVIVNKEPDGTVVITDGNGNEHRLPPGTEAAIVDDQGNGTLIDSKGNAHNVSGAVATAAANRTYNLALKFKEIITPNGYGFDALADNAPEALKNRYKNNKLDGEYYAPYKSIEAGKTDVVGAVLEGSIDKSKIRFERGGVPVTATPFSGNESTVTVTANSDGEEEALIAVLPAENESQKDQVLGRVNVVSYSQISKTVHIVPVNGNDYPFTPPENLQTELNKIYKQAVVNWTVEFNDGINVEGIEPFNVGETGMLTNYSDHMKKVINAYKAEMLNDENHYYLFLVSSPSDPSINGYMPRSKQAGFIFIDKNPDLATLTRTMAHELGHGAFNLHHTFMEEDFSLPEKSTDNLMDYAGGTKLYKYQWDMMRYPAIVMGLFEGDAEGENLLTNDLPMSLINSDGTFNFLTAGGTKITLPKEIIADFRYGITKPSSHSAPIGYLNSFKIRENNKEIHYVTATSESRFLGYYNVEEKKYYQDNLTAKNTFKNVILFVPGQEEYSFIKYNVDISPYTNNDPLQTYVTFPIKPYSQGLEVIKAESKGYNTIANLVANEKEQWTFNPEILNKYLDTFNGKPEHSYLLKIVELATAYPGVFQKFTVCWNNWSDTYMNFGTIQISCTGYWETNILAEHLDLRNKWKTDPVEFYKIFAQKLISFIEAYRLIGEDFFKDDIVEKWKNAPNKSAYRVELLNAVQTLSNENISSLITCENRIGSLAILNSESTVEIFEKEIIRLLRYVPRDQVACFLTALKEKSPIDDARLLYALTNDVHDEHLWVGENNYKELVKALWSLVLRDPNYAGKYNVSVIDGSNTVSFYDASFWSRAKQAFAVYGNCYYPLLESKVVFDEDCSITLSQVYVSGGLNASSLPSPKPWEDPFTLLLITNTSRLDMLTDISGQTRAAVMPALMLEYMDWKGTEQFSIDGVNAVLDLASTISGIGTVGQLRHLVKIQKAARLFDLTAGIAGISAGLFEEQIKDIPELQACINVIQIASAVTNIRAAFKKADNPAALLEIVDETSEGAQLNKVKNALDEIETKADILKNVNSKIQDGFLQKVEVYAFLNKVKKDLELTPNGDQAILNQIKRIEDKAGSIDEFKNAIKSLTTLSWLEDLPVPLKNDILSNDDLKKLFEQAESRSGLISAWNKLFNPNISSQIRANPSYLTIVKKQLGNFGDKVEFKLERVLKHIEPSGYDRFFDALDNPKSIDHVRSLVGDFENIPGLALSKYVNNSLPKIDVPAPSTWANPLLALPGETATTFTKSVTAKTLTPGQKIYRVLSLDQRPSGGFWTYELPQTKAELYGGTAVRPEWNGGTHYVEYTVPETGLKIWDGPTASQPVLKGIDEVNLPGGEIQIYIPDPYRELGNIFDNLQLKPIVLK